MNLKCQRKLRRQFPKVHSLHGNIIQNVVNKTTMVGVVADTKVKWKSEVLIEEW
jgi:hypothetical protein